LLIPDKFYAIETLFGVKQCSALFPAMSEKKFLTLRKVSDDNNTYKIFIISKLKSF